MNQHRSVKPNCMGRWNFYEGVCTNPTETKEKSTSLHARHLCCNLLVSFVGCKPVHFKKSLAVRRPDVVLNILKKFSILIIEFEVPARQGPARRPLPVAGPGPTRFKEVLCPGQYPILCHWPTPRLAKNTDSAMMCHSGQITLTHLKRLRQ